MRPFGIPWKHRHKYRMEQYTKKSLIAPPAAPSVQPSNDNARIFEMLNKMQARLERQERYINRLETQVEALRAAINARR